MAFLDPLHRLGKKLFKPFGLKHKKILLVVCALLGGYIVDDFTGRAYPLFTIIFTCFAGILFFIIEEEE